MNLVLPFSTLSTSCLGWHRRIFRVFRSAERGQQTQSELNYPLERPTIFQPKRHQHLTTYRPTACLP